MSTKLFGGAYKETNVGFAFNCDCGTRIENGDEFISVYLVDYDGVCTDGYEVCTNCQEATTTSDEAKKELKNAYEDYELQKIEMEEWNKRVELQNKRARGEKKALENKAHRKAVAKHWKKPIADAFAKHFARA